MAPLWRRLLAACAAVACVGEGDPHLEELQRAASLQGAGQIDEAAAIYEGVLRVEPEHPDALHLLGIAYYARLDATHVATGVAPSAEDVQVCVDLVGRAAAKRPRDHHLLTNFGELLRWAGEADRALEVLREATRLKPDSVSAWRNTAAVQFEREDWCGQVEANANALRALGADALAASPSPRALEGDEYAGQVERVARFDLGEAMQRCRSFEEGWRIFSAAVNAWPDDARINLGAGVNAQQLGLLDVAARMYEASAREAGDDGPLKKQALVNRAAVDHERGEMLTAIEGYRAVLRTWPEDTQHVCHHGSFSILAGSHQLGLLLPELPERRGGEGAV